MKTIRLLLTSTLLSGFFCGTVHSQVLENVTYQIPHFTEYTLRVPVPEGTEVEAVSEGIVTLRSQNKLAFYSIAECRMLSDFVWQGVGRYGQVTAFSGGACAVKKDGVFHILYPDGSSKDLSKTDIREIGPFRDGIAAGKKKKGDYGSEPAFFDKDGRSVLGSLLQGLGSYAELSVREVHEGLRAVQAGKWGFVNADGQVVIAPKYDRVSDFSEGYALVSSSGGMFGIIDKKGSIVLAETIQGGYQDPRAFHDGWAFFPANNRFTDLQGKLVDVSAGTTDFSGGRCFAIINYTEAGLIEKDLTTEKILKGHDGSALHFPRNAPTHPIGGHYILEDYSDTYLFDTEGHMRLATNTPNCFMTGLYEGNLISLSYTKSGDVYSIDAVGVCDFDGAVIVLFDSKDAYPEVSKEPVKTPISPEPIIPDPPQPEPVEPDPPQPEPEKPQQPQLKEDPREPPVEKDDKTVATFKAFVVDISGEWPAGKQPSVKDVAIYSNIPPGTVCKPGDTLRFAVTPPEGGVLKEPLLNGKSVIPVAPGVYKAALPAGTSTVKIGIVAAEKVDMKKTALRGHRVFTFEKDGVSNLEADVIMYTEPDGISGTPFGDDVQGLLIVDFDQSKKLTLYVNNSKEYPVPEFGTFFWGPYRITGFSEENGKKYLHLTGGISAIGNWMDQKDPDMGGLLVTMLVSMSTFNEDNTGGDPTYALLNGANKYRLSYTDTPGGGIKLGLFERFSTAYGWVPSDDKRLIKKRSKNYGFVTFHESSEAPMEPDLLEGTELKLAPRPSGLPNFYPGRNWFLDEEQYQHTVSVFDRMYRSQTEKDFGARWYTREECTAFVVDYVARWKMAIAEGN